MYTRYRSPVPLYLVAPFNYCPLYCYWQQIFPKKIAFSFVFAIYGYNLYKIHVVFGGSLELPMWLTDGFLVTFFGRWWGSCVHTRESRTATVHGAPYTVNSCVVVGAIYAYMCTYSYRTRWTHVWWWGQYTHTCVPTATVHGAPYTVYSRVVVGAIYAYMCTYSYRTRCTMYSAPYTVYSHVVVGAIYAYMCTYSYRTRWTHVWRGHSRVGATHVCRGHSRVGVTHVWDEPPKWNSSLLDIWEVRLYQEACNLFVH